MTMTPGEAIRKQCVECNGGNFAEVHLCDAGKQCTFHKYRLGRGRPSVKLMRKFCMECMCNSYDAVRECSTEDCTIHPYRFGKAVNRTEMSEERKAILSIGLSRGRTRMAEQNISRSRTRSGSAS